MTIQTDRPASLYERATSMLAHCGRSGVKISPYWRGYVENTLTELNLVDDDVFSDKYYFAYTFGGGTFGYGRNPSPVDQALERFAQALSKPFSKRIPWQLRKSPAYRRLFGRLFALSVMMRKNQSRKNTAQAFYAHVVRFVYDTLQADIAAYDLKPRTRRTADDVDIPTPRSSDRTSYFSLATLQRFRTLTFFQRLADAQGKILVEIGSGAGEMARLYLALGLTRRYILVDIPPALAFAERHMVEEFGAAAVDSFNPDRATVDLEDGKLVTVLTPDQLRMIAAADIGINQASFGEMAPSIVERYANELKRMNVKHFFSINHRLSKPNNQSHIGKENYVRFFSPEMKLQTAKSFHFNRLLPSLLDDQPDLDDYQLLHFVR